MKISAFLLIVLGLAACQGTPRQDHAASQNTLPATAPSAPAPSSQCYIRVTGRDTVFLQLETIRDSVHGRLTYRNFEKDSSEGTVRGTRKDNIIDIEYTFNSEGMTSVRRIVLREENGQLYEGLASSFDKEGNPIYDADYNKISYDKAAFAPEACR